MVADVTVIGAGVVALATAIELADRGLVVQLVGTAHHGEASSAAAGMLNPSVEPELEPVRAFAEACRERYPEYLRALQERTQILVPLNRRGALIVALDEREADRLQNDQSETSTWLNRKELAGLEPALEHSFGALHLPHDGCIDPLRLLDALRLCVARHNRIQVVTENVCTLEADSTTSRVTTDRENIIASRWVVLAAGAWTPQIERRFPEPAVPIALPVEPVLGEIVAYEGSPLRHVTCGPRGYLVPRADGHTLAGSTFERAGFTHGVTAQGVETVRSIGEEICPTLRDTPVSATWSGLRPVTPDMLPIIGPDPEQANVVYACGHSRNGILLTPLTAELVADIVTERPSRYEAGRFRPDRF
jgi:glycine oxidase